MIVLLVAILSGALSVLTPCVLPLLPAILATSTGTGRRRPLGIVVGLVTSFTIALLAFATIVRALHIPSGTLRYVAAAILVVFGATLIVPQLERAFERAAGVLARLSPSHRASGDGFGAGLLAGAGLGLVWAPCVGPIVAGVAVASATSATSGQQVARAIAFGIGMSVPLFLIVFGGQHVAGKLRARVNPKTVQRVAGAIMLATGVFIVSGLDTKTNAFLARETGVSSTLIAGLESDALHNNDKSHVKFAGKDVSDMTVPKGANSSGLPVLGDAPDFRGITQWINTPGGTPLTMRGLRGKVVLIDFWTYSCINCIRTLPRVTSWYDTYAKDGLVVVGVHSPEFEFEKVAKNVRRAVKDYKIRYPVAMDNDLATWSNYDNQYWPAEYLIDAQGRVRATHFGEGNYDETEKNIRALLREASGTTHGAQPGMTKAAAHDDAIQANTPETYVGFERGERFAGQPAGGVVGQFVHDQSATYARGATLDLAQWDFEGAWTSRAERATAGANAHIDFHYDAADVYLVLSPPSSGSAVVTVHDGASVRKVTVDHQDLYTLRSSETAADRTMRIDVPPGVSAYAFTFG